VSAFGILTPPFILGLRSNTTSTQRGISFGNCLGPNGRNSAVTVSLTLLESRSTGSCLTCEVKRPSSAYGVDYSQDAMIGHHKDNRIMPPIVTSLYSFYFYLCTVWQTYSPTGGHPKLQLACDSRDGRFVFMS
jgi:hypothetical protein